MSLEERINQDIKKAMLAKEEAELRALRAIKSALLLAKTEKNAGEMNEELEIKILQKQVKQRRESADIYITQNRLDLAGIEQEELEVIGRYLPKQLTESEVEVIVRALVSSTGASGAKDMSKLMGAASAKLAGQVDGKVLSTVVRKVLN